MEELGRPLPFIYQMSFAILILLFFLFATLAAEMCWSIVPGISVS